MIFREEPFRFVKKMQVVSTSTSRNHKPSDRGDRRELPPPEQAPRPSSSSSSSSCSHYSKGPKETHPEGLHQRHGPPSTPPQSRSCKETPSAPLSPGSSLTFSRNWLKQMAVQTLDIASAGYYINRHGHKVNLRQALQHSIQHSEHYHCSHIFPPPPPPTPTTTFDRTSRHDDSSSSVTTFDTQFYICYGSSLQVASELVHHKKYQSPNNSHDKTTVDIVKTHVGILNSASGKTPSKFLRGTISPVRPQRKKIYIFKKSLAWTRSISSSFTILDFYITA